MRGAIEAGYVIIKLKVLTGFWALVGGRPGSQHFRGFPKTVSSNKHSKEGVNK
ncbi:MAG: hypothetical protein WAX69_15280 [Victivallales bacterium]